MSNAPEYMSTDSIEKITSSGESGRSGSLGVEAVEKVLDLADEDREGLQGLYRFNVVSIPRLRFVGTNLLFLVAALHNVLVFGELDLRIFLPVLIGAELYCLFTWGALRSFFARISSVHLGHVFLTTDLVLFTVAVWVSGGHQSLLWPVFILRTADQLWAHRGRAKLMAALGPVAYAVLLAYQALVEGQSIVWGGEVAKLTILASMNLFLVSVAAAPWRQRERTHQAKELILRLEEESAKLDEARQQAEHANRSKSEFLGRMSHELRTPLNSVLGFTNVLLKKKQFTSSPRELDYLQRIRLNGMHLLDLVNDLLDLNRIEEGKIVVELKDVDLARLIEETVDQLEAWGLKENVKTYIVVPPRLDSIRADESRLRQVLINLVGNAVKFTEEGSITIRVDADGYTARKIHVEDTGSGIPPERIETIFTAFEQVDGATSRTHPGSGLGLAISRALCGLMEMRLSVESVLGRGSTFTISLPATPPR